MIQKPWTRRGLSYYNNHMDARSTKSPQESKQRKKAKKPGRPKLPKGAAKGRIVPVRVTGDTLKRIAQAAEANDQTLSEWIRSTLLAAIQ